MQKPYTILLYRDDKSLLCAQFGDFDSLRDAEAYANDSLKRHNAADYAIATEGITFRNLGV